MSCGAPVLKTRPNRDFIRTGVLGFVDPPPFLLCVRADPLVRQTHAEETQE